MLTPFDVHRKEFQRVFRGYSEQEVDEFLTRVAEAMERLYRENEQLRASGQAAGKAAGVRSLPSGAGRFDGLEQPATGRLGPGQAETKVPELLKEMDNIAGAALAEMARQAEETVLLTEQRMADLVVQVENKTRYVLDEAEKRLEALLSGAAERFRLLLSEKAGNEDGCGAGGISSSIKRTRKKRA
ncbi:MAG: DivIVA domain-containing protein [Bacillota bacterium]